MPYGQNPNVRFRPPADNSAIERPIVSPAVILQKISSQSKSYSSTLIEKNLELFVDFVFAPKLLNSLSDGNVKSYIYEKKGEFEQKTKEKLNFMLQLISIGQLNYTVQNENFFIPGSSNEVHSMHLDLSSAKVGIDSNGEVFLLISQEDYLKISRLHSSRGERIVLPDHVRVDSDNSISEKLSKNGFVSLNERNDMIENSQIIFEGSRKNGSWNFNSILNEENAHELLSPFLLADSHFIHYVVLSQESMFNSELISQCAKPLAIKNALAISENSAQLLIALNLLEDGEKMLHSIYVEKQIFLSFSNCATSTHDIIFARNSNGEYLAVDAKNKVRGKGKTKEEALEDLATCGFSPSGLYYVVPQIQIPNISSEIIKPTSKFEIKQIVAVAKKDSAVYTALRQASEFIHAGYIIRHPLAVGTAILGTISNLIFQYTDSEDRAFHKGSKFRWDGSDAQLFFADILFSIGALSGLPKLAYSGAKFANAFSNMAKAELPFILGFGTLFADSIITDSASKSILEDTNILLSDIFVPFSSLESLLDAGLFSSFRTNGIFGKMSDDEFYNKIYNQWLPLITGLIPETMNVLGVEGDELTSQQLRLILLRISWLNENVDLVKQMSSLTGIDSEHIALNFIIYGGVRVEGSVEQTHNMVNNFSNNFSDIFDYACDYICNSSANKKYLFSNKDKELIKLDLKVAWIRGQINLSEIYKMAKIERDVKLGF